MMKELEFVSADQAVAAVRDHDHIHLGSIASTPKALIDALVRRAEDGTVRDLHFHHFHTEGPAPYADPKFEGIFFEQGFFVGSNVRESVNSGYADYLPVHLSESGQLYRSGAIRLGVAMVQISEPDSNGMVSLGTSVDCSIAAIETARTVIGVVNPHVPFAYGDLVPVEKFDFLVRDDTPLIERPYMEPGELEVKIGTICSGLIDDGACLQMGIGSLPNAIAAHLADHRNLGIHSEMFADGVLDLIGKGVITGAEKKLDRGKVTASFLLGSRKVYDFIDRNPMVLMKDIKYVNNPINIASNPKATAVNSATEVDFTGQICADSIGTRIYSGTGGQLDFVRGATMSEGGRSLTVFTSRTKKGQSKIVPVLRSGAGVVTPRPDAHIMVTEYGWVDLTGRSLQERAKLMISIAHPDDREMLERAAFERFGPHFLNFSI